MHHLADRRLLEQEFPQRAADLSFGKGQSIDQESLHGDFVQGIDRPTQLDEADHAVICVPLGVLNVDADPLGLTERQNGD